MINLKKKHYYILIGLSAILLTLPWLRCFSGVILFIAFVPLLLIERYLYNSRKANKSIKAFIYSYITFLIWNFITTYWIYNATIFGAIAAIVINSLFMATVFWLFHITHRKLGHRYGYFGLLVYWTAFEYIYLNVTVSWPWLNLGNGLAKDIGLIQWYEFTGATSGTPWILLINILIFLIILEYIEKQTIRKKIFELIIVLVLIFFPVVYSLIRFYNYIEPKNPYEIVVLQPNIDPYNEKFSGLSNYEQLSIILNLADSLTKTETDYVVGPETAIDDNIWESNLGNNPSVKRLQDFIIRYPNTKFIIGMTSLYRYSDTENPPLTARKFTDVNAWYDVFNASMQIDTSNDIQVYHKSKLVIGVEQMPFPRLFKGLEKFIINIGGTTSGYGIQKERTTLNEPGGNGKVGIMICYESVYGEFVTDYVKKGANMLFVITNDGWWGNTAGYKQHLTYSSLRAIETRRSIARSANTGISCFINQKGQILQPTLWWKKDAIKATINANDKQTYYVKHGDFISRIALFFGIITLLYTLVAILMTRK